MLLLEILQSTYREHQYDNKTGKCDATKEQVDDAKYNQWYVVEMWIECCHAISNQNKVQDGKKDSRLWFMKASTAK